VQVGKGKSISFSFDAVDLDSVSVEVSLLPVHPLTGKSIRFRLSLDGTESPVTDYATQGRSEEWKTNVLCNQAVRRFILPLKRQAAHQLILTALDDGVVIDKVMLGDR